MATPHVHNHTAPASQEPPPGITDLGNGTCIVDASLLERLLRQAGHVRIDLNPTPTPKNSEGLTVIIVLEGTDITARITNAGVIMRNRDFTTLNAKPGRLRSRFAKHRTLENPTIETLMRHGLPLYWNEEWLREKVDACGTFAEVARSYSKEVLGVNATTIANYARDTFGWRVREETARKRILALREYERTNGEVTQTSLASRLGVSVSTINRWLATAHESYATLRRHQQEIINDPKAREAFIAQHAIDEDMLNGWLEGKPSIFASARAPQRKNHYYSKEDYAAKRELAKKVYLERDGAVDKSALARELGVDRSTITNWLNAFDAEEYLRI